MGFSFSANKPARCFYDSRLLIPDIFLNMHKRTRDIGLLIVWGLIAAGL